MTSAGPRSVIVEADGGSRGNPGPAAYGALLKDAETGELIAERGETIGIATNNVAEYRGLIAGLELAAEHAPEADIEVRMDSKLVVEQMSGNWKIKHPDMKPLAMRGQPAGAVRHDLHLDAAGRERARRPAGQRGPRRAPRRARAEGGAPCGHDHDHDRDATATQTRGWGPPRGKPTTLVLVRHGVTDATTGKLFSGGLGSTNPSLNDEGRDQARATGEWLAPMAETFDALVTSPVRRTRETAEILAKFLDLEVTEEPGLAEMEFGSWDGLSFTEVREKWPDELSAWLGDLDSAPHGGESFRSVEKRVLEGKDRLLAAYAGQTVVVVSHVTPIKTLVAEALGRTAGLASTGWSWRRRRSASSPTSTWARTATSRWPACACTTPGRRTSSARAAAVDSELLDDHVERVALTGRAAPSSAFQPSAVIVSARAAGVPGAAPCSSRARTRRPLVALLKWLTTERRPSVSCSTRTVATRGARSGAGRQNEAYVVERRSTTRPVPARSRTTGSRTPRQWAATGPSPGSEVAPGSR